MIACAPPFFWRPLTVIRAPRSRRDILGAIALVLLIRISQIRQNGLLYSFEQTSVRNTGKLVLMNTTTLIIIILLLLLFGGGYGYSRRRR